MFQADKLPASINVALQRASYFLTLSFAVSFAILLGFVVQANGIDSPLSFVYVLGIASYYLILLLLIHLVITPLAWLSRWVSLIVVFKSLADILLLGDLLVFRIYRFHIDSMFINMLLFDFKGIGLSWKMVVLAALVSAAIFALNLWFFKKAGQVIVSKRDGSLPSGKKLAGYVLGIFIVGQLIHVVGYEYKQRNITRYTPYFPYYKPLTSSSLMAKLQRALPAVFPQRSEADDNDVAALLADGKSQGGLIAYPKQPLQCDVNSAAKSNVLMVVLESWRFDALSEQITPNINAVGQQAHSFLNHISSGNVTVNGLFGLMYGLHPTYRDVMASDPYLNQSLLTRTLKKAGYQTSVYTSSNLDRFSLKAMFFGKIDDADYHNPTKQKTDVNDRLATDLLLQDLGQTTNQPWFKFLFLTSSHHSYYAPEPHRVFTPIENNPEAFVFNKYMAPEGMVNRYHNSLHYVDSLVGEVVDKLKQTGQWQDTYVIITSDHGEEFNDFGLGYWGHGSNFTRSQIGVPLVIKLPKQTDAQAIQYRTSHIDIMPTLMRSELGCTNPASDYSNGVDLFSAPENSRPLVLASYKDKAYLIDQAVHATGLTVESYDFIDLTQGINEIDFSAIQAVKQQERWFLDVQPD